MRGSESQGEARRWVRERLDDARDRRQPNPDTRERRRTRVGTCLTPTLDTPAPSSCQRGGPNNRNDSGGTRLAAAAATAADGAAAPAPATAADATPDPGGGKAAVPG